MADTKISSLTDLGGVPAVDDEFVIVDKSDTSMAATGTDKKLTWVNLFPGGWTEYAIPFSPLVSAPASVVTGVANTYYASQVVLLGSTTLTGIRYRVGTVSNGNVRVALYDSAGVKVADKTSDTAQGSANAAQGINFDSTFAASARRYYALLWFSSATATFYGARILSTVITGTNATTTPTSISGAAVANVEYPIVTVF